MKRGLLKEMRKDLLQEGDGGFAHGEEACFDTNCWVYG